MSRGSTGALKPSTFGMFVVYIKVMISVIMRKDDDDECLGFIFDGWIEDANSG